jgi:hypothetical protein
VPKFSSAVLLQFMLVSFFAGLGAKPQLPVPMHDQTELSVAVSAAISSWVLRFRLQQRDPRNIVPRH